MSIDNARTHVAAVFCRSGYSQDIPMGHATTGLAVRAVAAASPTAEDGNRVLCLGLGQIFPKLQEALPRLASGDGPLAEALMALRPEGGAPKCILAFCRMVARGLGDHDPASVAPVIAWSAPHLADDVAALNASLSRLRSRSDGKAFPSNPTNHTKVTCPRLLEAVSHMFGVSEDAVRSPCRQKDLAHARHIVVFLTRKFLPVPYREIEKLLGNRNRSTLVKSMQAAEKLLREDPELRNRVGALMSSTFGNLAAQGFNEACIQLLADGAD